MAFSSASVAIFKFDSTEGGALTDISEYVTSVELPQSRSDLKLPLIGGNGVRRLAGNIENEITVKCFHDPTAYAMFASNMIANPASRSFEYSPQGSGSGTDKLTGECFVIKLTPRSDAEKAAEFDVTLAIDGEVASGTN